MLDRFESSVCLFGSLVSVLKESKSTVLFIRRVYGTAIVRIFLSCRFIYFPFYKSLLVFVVRRFLSICPFFKKKKKSIRRVKLLPSNF